MVWIHLISSNAFQTFGNAFASFAVFKRTLCTFVSCSEEISFIADVAIIIVGILALSTIGNETCRITGCFIKINKLSVEAFHAVVCGIIKLDDITIGVIKRTSDAFFRKVFENPTAAFTHQVVTVISCTVFAIVGAILGMKLTESSLVVFLVEIGAIVTISLVEGHKVASLNDGVNERTDERSIN